MKIKDCVEQWSDMYFSYNPYGEAIPSKYLFEESLIRKYDWRGDRVYIKNLSELKQDGWCSDFIMKADPDAPWEIKETVLFSPLFHRLMEEGKMCPANYVVHIIKELDEYVDEDEKENKIIHSFEFYIGMIARGLRALASYIREYSLSEGIDDALSEISKNNSVKYEMYGTSVEQDMKYKTDILFKYDRRLYRAWSYLVTDRGVRNTSGRVLKANGYGYNILFPFDMREKKNTVDGWYLYDKTMVKNIVCEHIVNNNGDVITHQDYCQKVIDTPEIIKKPVVFFVG